MTKKDAKTIDVKGVQGEAQASLWQRFTNWLSQGWYRFCGAVRWLFGMHRKNVRNESAESQDMVERLSLRFAEDYPAFYREDMKELGISNRPAEEIPSMRDSVNLLEESMSLYRLFWEAEQNSQQTGLTLNVAKIIDFTWDAIAEAIEIWLKCTHINKIKLEGSYSKTQVEKLFCLFAAFDYHVTQFDVSEIKIESDNLNQSAFSRLFSGVRKGLGFESRERGQLAGFIKKLIKRNQLIQKLVEVSNQEAGNQKNRTVLLKKIKKQESSFCVAPGEIEAEKAKAQNSQSKKDAMPVINIFGRPVYFRAYGDSWDNARQYFREFIERLATETVSQRTADAVTMNVRGSDSSGALTLGKAYEILERALGEVGKEIRNVKTPNELRHLTLQRLQSAVSVEPPPVNSGEPTHQEFIEAMNVVKAQLSVGWVNLSVAPDWQAISRRQFTQHLRVHRVQLVKTLREMLERDWRNEDKHYDPRAHEAAYLQGYQTLAIDDMAFSEIDYLRLSTYFSAAGFEGVLFSPLGMARAQRVFNYGLIFALMGTGHASARAEAAEKRAEAAEKRAEAAELCETLTTLLSDLNGSLSELNEPDLSASERVEIENAVRQLLRQHPDLPEKAATLRKTKELGDRLIKRCQAILSQTSAEQVQAESDENIGQGSASNVSYLGSGGPGSHAGAGTDSLRQEGHLDEQAGSSKRYRA